MREKDSPDIFVSLKNGDVLSLSGIDLSINWKVDTIPYVIVDDWVSGMYVMNADEVFIGSTAAFYAKITSNNGAIIWSGRMPTVILSPSVPVDINTDGIMDFIFMSNNFSFAINGDDGTQLWNITMSDYNIPLLFDPILIDLNGDNVLDVIYINFLTISPNPDVYAVDSTNGKLSNRYYLTDQFIYF